MGRGLGGAMLRRNVLCSVSLALGFPSLSLPRQLFLNMRRAGRSLVILSIALILLIGISAKSSYAQVSPIPTSTAQPPPVSPDTVIKGIPCLTSKEQALLRAIYESALNAYNQYKAAHDKLVQAAQELDQAQQQEAQHPDPEDFRQAIRHGGLGTKVELATDRMIVAIRANNAAEGAYREAQTTYLNAIGILKGKTCGETVQTPPPPPPAAYSKLAHRETRCPEYCAAAVDRLNAAIDLYNRVSNDINRTDIQYKSEELEVCEKKCGALTQPGLQQGLLPGNDKDGHDTPDKPGGDAKTTDTKTPLKDDKAQKTDTAKTGQADKSVTGKDDKPSKATAEKQIPKGTKKLTGLETATARKTAKQAKDKPKEDKTQVHIEFFSTGGRMGGGGFGR